MSTEITFDDSKFKIRSAVVPGTPEVPAIIRFLIVKKLVKNENQATAIILSLVVLLICVTVYLIRASVTVQPAIPSPELSATDQD